MQKTALAFFVFLVLLLAGCTSQTPFQSEIPDGQRSVNPNDFEGMPFDPNDVCPFECCKNEERYYDNPCQSGSCVNNKCVIAKVEPTTPLPEGPLELAENEIYPGVFIEILGAVELPQNIKENDNELVGKYLMDEKRKGIVIGFEEGKKVIVVELTVENRSFDGELIGEFPEYNRILQDGEALMFFIANDSGEKYDEVRIPPRDFDPVTENFSDQPPIYKGEKYELFIAFLAPNSFEYGKLIMTQNDEFLEINRTLEFELN